MKTPSTTVEFLDALKAKNGWTSDYQLWKALGWKQTSVSNYRVGRSAMAGPHAIRIADELGLPRAYVLACMEAERESGRDDEVASTWRAAAVFLRRASAASILLAVLVLGFSPDSSAASVAYAFSLTPAVISHDISYAKYLLRCAVRRALRFLQDLLNPVTIATALAA